MVNDIIFIENKKIMNSNEKNVTDLGKNRINKKFNQINNQLMIKEKEIKNKIKILFISEQFNEIKEKEKKKIFINNNAILLSLILSYNLVDSFPIIFLINSFLNLFFSFIKEEIKIYCDKKGFKRKSNFNEYLLNQILKELLDLNKINILNITGINLSNTISFKYIISIFIVITFLFLSLANDINYDIYFSEVLNYSYKKFLLIFCKCDIYSYYLSLIFQQIFINFYFIFNSYTKEMKNI